MAEYKVITGAIPGAGVPNVVESQLNTLAKQKWELAFVTAVPPYGSLSVPTVIAILKK